MDVLENLSGKLRAHATEGSLGSTLVENLVVTAGLNDGHVVLLLVGTNLAANAHTLSQEIHQLVVALVNLTAQLVQTLCRIMLIAHYEHGVNENGLVEAGFNRADVERVLAKVESQAFKRALEPPFPDTKFYD